MSFFVVCPQHKAPYLATRDFKIAYSDGAYDSRAWCVIHHFAPSWRDRDLFGKTTLVEDVCRSLFAVKRVGHKRFYSKVSC